MVATKEAPVLHPAEVAKLEAETETLRAEKRAYEAEAEFHELQTERLVRAREDEESALEAQRVYDFTSEVSFGSVRTAINTLAEWHAKDPGVPITFRILTPGGDALAGLALFDYIRQVIASGTPVTTMAIGLAASMGAVLLQAGSTRLVTPSAWIMIHEVSNVASGKLSEIIDEAKWTTRIQDRLLTILAERSHLSKTQIKNKWKRKDWWLDAKEAVTLGFADAIAETV